MLKLNASFSKKVPANQEFSSKGYSATIEMELPSGLTRDQLQSRIHETFELVRESVENEIGDSPEQLPMDVAPQPISYPVNNNANHQQRPANNGNGRRNGNGNGNGKASPKQIKYLLDIANGAQIHLGGYLQGYGLNRVEDLNRQQCSQLIDQVLKQSA